MESQIKVKLKEVDKILNNIIMLLDNAFKPDVRVYKEAKYLVKHNYNVKIICLDKKNEFKDKELENYDGIMVKRIFVRSEKITKLMENNKFIRIFQPAIYLWWLVKFILRTKKQLKNEEFDILHCHDLTMAFIGCIFFRKKKIVFDMHEYYGNNNSKLSNFIINKIVLYTQNKAKWIIFVNEYQKLHCKEKNKSKLIELPNYPEIDTFRDVEKTESKKVRISYIGKVRDFASLSKFINCVDDKKNINISIYGDGSEFQRLLNYAKQGEKQYMLKGSYDGIKEVQNIYKNTDILYAVYDITSKDGINWKNAMPIKSFEAIITLTPIIASKNTILGYFVQKNDIGFVIDEKNEEELANLFKLLENTPDLIKEKVKNLRKMQYRYTWEKVSKNLDKIYIIGEEQHE